MCSSDLFNLLILGLDDVFYRPGPILLAADASHLLSVLGVMLANAIFLIGLTQQVLTKRFRVAWDSLAIAGVYAATVWLLLRMHG